MIPQFCSSSHQIDAFGSHDYPYQRPTQEYLRSANSASISTTECKTRLHHIKVDSFEQTSERFFFRTKHVYQLHITVSGFPWKSLNAWRRRACARGCRAGKLPFNEIRLWWLMCVCDTPGGVFIPSRGFRWVCVWAWVGGCLLFRANLIIHFMRICK